MTLSEVLVPFIMSLVLTAVFLPLFINYAHRHKQGQMIREEGPKWHEKKSGTPTMGGFVFNLVILFTGIVVPLMFKCLDAQVLVLDFILLLYGFLGFWDDSIKLWHRQNEGLKPWQKFLGQIVGAIIFVLVYAHEGLPFSLSFFGYEIHLGFLYALFAIFWLVGFSNAVNLTDGIDGLVAGQSIIAFGAYGIIAAAQRQLAVMIFCLAVIGALTTFLFFNHRPAKIFMGDMGSLALGGALAAVSLLVHHGLSLLFIGIIFVIETASVILQVTLFRLTGKRIFKMSPIHHHFELCGWNEWKIDIVFWTIGLIAAIISLIVIL